MGIDEDALEAALNEAGSGWGTHLGRSEKRNLMRQAISAYEAAKAPTTGQPEHVNDINVVDIALNEAECGLATHQPVELPGDSLPAGMVKIGKLIADLQSTMGQFGDTCVYIKPGVSWGAVALNRQSDDAKAIEKTAASFAATFKAEYKELAQQIMGYAISEGWTHPSSPEREAVGWQPLETAPPGYTKDKGFEHVLFKGHSKAFICWQRLYQRLDGSRAKTGL